MCFHVCVGMSWLVLISKLSGVRADDVLVRLLLTGREASVCDNSVSEDSPRRRGWGCAAKGKPELG